MAREMRRSVILSQGGKHGAHARTYVKATSVPASVADLIPVTCMTGVDTALPAATASATTTTTMVVDPSVVSVTSTPPEDGPEDDRDETPAPADEPSAVAPKPLNPAISPPTDDSLRAYASKDVGRLQRWPLPRLQKLAEQEGVGGANLNKADLVAVLSAHLGAR